ncbi:hypothetical protein, partial [Pantoea brenneri]|uniref:hypothetical protein n=1 Tax=Pantoea brenneri TaxID=472694 RepID=UPI00197ED706
GTIPPLRDLPVARPEIPHRLSASDGLPTPRCYFFFYDGYFIAVGFWDCLWLSAQQTKCYSTHPLLSILFMSGILSLWIFGIVFSIGSADSAAL